MKSILLTIVLCLSLGACNTVSGIGKDITDSAEWGKEKISGQ